MARGEIARRILVLLPFLASCTNVQAPTRKPAEESPFLTRVREVMARVPDTLAKNHKTFAVPDGTIQGFGAGEAYPQIWLRDSAWLVPAAASYYDAESLISWLDLHLKAGEKNGRLRDWVAAASPETFREWAPRVQAKGPLAVDTNSNESDQEPSAALAYCRIVEALRGQDAVTGAVHVTRVARLLKSMDALVRDRTDPRTGLVWSGLTADWGDVSPLYPDQRAIYLDAHTPKTLSLYSNVMTWAALDCLASLEAPAALQESLRSRAAKLRDRIRSAFWMKDRGFFRIRLPLDPVPAAFKDEDRFALGGNALAALFGLADEAEAASIFENAERLRTANHFSTISTTLIPPYPAGVFQHPAMREPFRYQNGGQWDWFGAALVQAEFERGYSEQARAHLDQIATRVLKAGPGLHEWYAQDGSPGGSASYAASAAAIHNAVVEGLLGISRSTDGLRVVLRAADTLPRFQIPQRAAAGRLEVSQTVGAAAIDVEVLSSAPVSEVCSLLPAGRIAAPGDGLADAALRSTRRIGLDTLLCARVSSTASPIRVRFALRP